MQRLALRWGWFDTDAEQAVAATSEVVAGAAALMADTLRCLDLDWLEDDMDLVLGEAGLARAPASGGACMRVGCCGLRW